jgi:hypothetical protein
MNTQEYDTLPWYRQFWPWFIIALPTTAVIASFATLFIAVTNAPDLVIEDYTRIGEISMAQLDRDRRATELDLHATVTFRATDNPQQQLLSIRLRGNDNARLPARIILKSVHSTLPSLDVEAELASSDGYYSGIFPLLIGTYNLHIVDPERSWKLSARSSGQPVTLELASLPATVSNQMP